MDKYCKYDRYRKYVSYDGGQTWQPMDEYKTGELIEENSQECGYVGEINDPTLPMYKWEYDGYECAECANEMSNANKKAYGVRVDGVTYEIPCNGDGLLTVAEIEEYTNFYTDYKLIKTIIIGDCVTAFDHMLLERHKDTIEYIEYGKNLKAENYLAIRNSKSLNTVIIRGSSFSVSNYESCESLSSVTIDYGPNKIYSLAFSGCKALKSIDIPGSVKYIGDQAFGMCYSLENVTIGDGVKMILDRAFISCSGFTNLNIPDTVEFIGYMAFMGCDSLETLRIGKSVKCIEHEVFAGCKSLTSVTIPDSVEYIGDSVFSRCTNLKSVKLSNNLKIINRTLFINCPSLESIIIPNGVKTIGDGAFSGCTNLTSVTIPDSVEYIESQAFEKCTSLTSIQLPKNLKHIGQYYADKSTLPNGVEYIEYAYFSEGIETFTFPNSVKVVGDFLNSTSNVYKVTSVTIGTEITSIGTVFYYNTVIKSFTVLATTPPGINSNSFYKATNITIYVPDASVDAYKKADVWSKYADKIKPLSSKP